MNDGGHPLPDRDPLDGLVFLSMAVQVGRVEQLHGAVVSRSLPASISILRENRAASSPL